MELKKEYLHTHTVPANKTNSQKDIKKISNQWLFASIASLTRATVDGKQRIIATVKDIKNNIGYKLLKWCVIDVTDQLISVLHKDTKVNFKATIYQDVTDSTIVRLNNISHIVFNYENNFLISIPKEQRLGYVDYINNLTTKESVSFSGWRKEKHYSNIDLCWQENTKYISAKTLSEKLNVSHSKLISVFEVIGLSAINSDAGELIYSQENLKSFAAEINILRNSEKDVYSIDELAIYLKANKEIVKKCLAGRSLANLNLLKLRQAVLNWYKIHDLKDQKSTNVNTNLSQEDDHKELAGGIDNKKESNSNVAELCLDAYHIYNDARDIYSFIPAQESPSILAEVNQIVKKFKFKAVKRKNKLSLYGINTVQRIIAILAMENLGYITCEIQDVIELIFWMTGGIESKDNISIILANYIQDNSIKKAINQRGKRVIDYQSMLKFITEEFSKMRSSENNLPLESAKLSNQIIKFDKDTKARYVSLYDFLKKLQKDYSWLTAKKLQGILDEQTSLLEQDLLHVKNSVFLDSVAQETLTHYIEQNKQKINNKTRSVKNDMSKTPGIIYQQYENQYTVSVNDLAISLGIDPKKIIEFVDVAINNGSIYLKDHVIKSDNAKLFFDDRGAAFIKDHFANAQISVRKVRPTQELDNEINVPSVSIQTDLKSANLNKAQNKPVSFLGLDGDTYTSTQFKSLKEAQNFILDANKNPYGKSIMVQDKNGVDTVISTKMVLKV